MKKFLLTLALFVSVVAAQAQGTVNFNNFVSGSVNAPIFNVDGVTRLSGTGFAVQLYGGAAGTLEANLVAIGGILNFRTGSGAGYLNPNSTDTTRAISGVTPGASATIQIRAWDLSSGATWETASIKGASDLLTLATGGVGEPPGLAANLVGLQSFQLVPEPSTYALGALGIGALLMARRRKV